MPGSIVARVEAGTLKRTPLYEAHVEAGAKLVAVRRLGDAGRVRRDPRRAPPRAERLRRLRRLAHGRDRDRGPAGGGPAPAAALQRRLEDPGRRRPVLVPLSRGRRRARRPLHLPAGRRSLPDRHATPPTTSATSSGSRLTPSSSRPRSATESTPSRCWRSRARRRARSSAGSPTASCPSASGPRSSPVAGAPTLVCGTGYTGEDGVELLMAPEDARARSGTR